jgi:tRNA threonylcarbamoyl adenosine modification protein (Sua5/YciO/YrdC/YwlC family)
MSQFFHIHPINPQPRLIREAVRIIRAGGVIIYPTDSAYALGCRLVDKDAVDRIRKIRQLDARHHFTLVCRDLSEISTYAKVDNHTFRLLKRLTPGPYTFLLDATKEVPKRLQHAKRKTIGVRIPDCQITLDLLTELHEPLMSCTLILPGENVPMVDPEEMWQHLGSQVDLVIDGGVCGIQPTSVIDLHSGTPVVVRQGKGDVKAFF